MVQRFGGLFGEDAESQWRGIFNVSGEVAEDAVSLNVNEKFLVIISYFLSRLLLKPVVIIAIFYVHL